MEKGSRFRPSQTMSPRLPRSTGKRNPRFARSQPVSPASKPLKERAMTGESLADASEDDLRAMIYDLSEDRRRLASTHQFKKAGEVNKAMKHAEKAVMQIQKNAFQKIAKEEFDQQDEEFKQKFADFDEETERLIQDLEDQLNKKRSALHAQHEQELDDFEERWTSPPKERLYNRASNTLTSLRRQLNVMLRQCDFDAAEEVEAQIQRRKASEESENTFIMRHDFNEALRKLQKKQADEKRHFEESAALKMKMLKDKRQRLRVRFLNREKYMERRQQMIRDSDKLWTHAQLHRDSISPTLRDVPPSLKVTKKDVDEVEVINLQLPRLFLPMRRNSSRRANSSRL